jgi:hypothetical protein
MRELKMTPFVPDNRPILTQVMAARWSPACDEYFEKFQDGVYDDTSYMQYVLAVQDIFESKEHPDLVIGFAGVDGIYFCFRQGESGVWAYYGIEDKHVLLAPTFGAFTTGWRNGTISV